MKYFFISIVTILILGCQSIIISTDSLEDSVGIIKEEARDKTIEINKRKKGKEK